MDRPDIDQIRMRFASLPYMPEFAHTPEIARGIIRDITEVIEWANELEASTNLLRDRLADREVEVGTLNGMVASFKLDAEKSDAKILELDTDLARTRRIIEKQGW